MVMLIDFLYKNYQLRRHWAEFPSQQHSCWIILLASTHLHDICTALPNCQSHKTEQAQVIRKWYKYSGCCACTPSWTTNGALQMLRGHQTSHQQQNCQAVFARLNKLLVLLSNGHGWTFVHQSFQQSIAWQSSSITVPVMIASATEFTSWRILEQFFYGYSNCVYCFAQAAAQWKQGLLQLWNSTCLRQHLHPKL